MVKDIKNVDLENLDLKDPKIYEVGYLLVPFLPADQVPGEVTKIIKAVVEAEGGEITSEIDPITIRLAYAVTKNLANKNNKFNDAYFGAIRFKLTPDKIAILKKSLDKDLNVLRYLIISLPKGSEKMVAPKRAYTARREERIPADMMTIERIDKDEPKKEEKAEMSKEELDKEIENLLVEPKK